MFRINKLSVVVVLLWPLQGLSLVLPPVPTEPIYYEPEVVEATPEQQKLGCHDLDWAINALHPYRYSYKKGFYDDQMNQKALALLFFDQIPFNALISTAYMGYSALVEEKEIRRQLTIEQKIATLQQLKAAQHCYE